MAKRPNPRAIRAARTYTIEEAALALNVSTSTVRSWVKAGLPLMQARRPYLILGDSLRAFLNSRASNAKVPLEQDQLFCFTCKAARVPMGLMVDCIPQTPKTARLLGLCEVCGGTCNRMVSRSQISLHSQAFQLAMKDGATA